MKICKSCGVEKELPQFNNNKRRKDGLETICKPCYNVKSIVRRKKYETESFEEPPDSILDTTKICIICNVMKPLKDFSKRKTCQHGRSNLCKECKNLHKKQYVIDNEINVRISNEIYRKNNKQKIKNYNKNRFSQKKDHISKINKKWRVENKEKVREIRRKYSKNNKHKFALKNSIKRARKRKSLHPLFDGSIYNTLYYTRLRLEKCLNIKFHIDHILPIAKGGYHHHGNLQVIPANLNSDKNDNLNYKHPILIHWSELPLPLLDRM